MNKKTTNLITLLGLAVFCVIIILPPILHGYIYPNVSDDSAVHLLVLDIIQNGDGISGLRYSAYYLTGYPMVWISNLYNVTIDLVFLWFNYISLILVGLTLFFVFSRLVNKLTGWLVLTVTLFCAQGLFWQFYYGQIYNIINIGMILPLLVLAIVKYFEHKSFSRFSIIFLLSLLFTSFHTSGIYLPAFILCGMFVYVVYSVVKKSKISWSIIFSGSLLVGVCALIFYWLVYSPTSSSLAGGLQLDLGFKSAITVPILNYLLSIVFPSVLVLIVLILAYYHDIVKNIIPNIKIVLVIYLIMVVVLGIVTFTKLTLDPWRQAVDLATVLAVLVSILIGILLTKIKKPVLYVAVIACVAFGFYHNLPAWLDNNNAIQKVDKQAIEFINTLDEKNYSCNASVAYWVYDRFIDKNWVNTDGELFIMRSKSMTPGSEINNTWYRKHGIELDERYEFIKSFESDNIVIGIFKR